MGSLSENIENCEEVFEQLGLQLDPKGKKQKSEINGILIRPPPSHINSLADSLRVHVLGWGDRTGLCLVAMGWCQRCRSQFHNTSLEGFQCLGRRNNEVVQVGTTRPD